MSTAYNNVNPPCATLIFWMTQGGLPGSQMAQLDPKTMILRQRSNEPHLNLPVFTKILSSADI
jgi:hypothetical protein